MLVVVECYLFVLDVHFGLVLMLPQNDSTNRTLAIQSDCRGDPFRWQSWSAEKDGLDSLQQSLLSVEDKKRSLDFNQFHP